MVAVVSGSGLGLFTSSTPTGNAQVGRGRDRVYVNTTTGNLVVQSTDDALAALGLDFAAVRTYNSQGLVDEDNGDQWRLGVHQRIYNLTGTVNTAGSTITKVFGDGAEVVYTWNATRSRYESNDGDGANDFLTWNSTNSSWTWTDGSSRATEEYGLVNGVQRIKFSRDADLNTVTYNYTGSLLTSINMAGTTAQTVNFDYTGNNLTAIRVVSNGVTQTLTRYSYDTSNRLQTVTLDLTPGDNSVSDNVTYTTTYTYDSTSKRIASITQKDGSSVSFTYQNLNGDYRLATVTDGEGRVTTYTYSQATGTAGGVATAAPANTTVLSNQSTSSYPRIDAALTTNATQQNSYPRIDSALSTTKTTSTTTPYPLNSALLTTPTAGAWGAGSVLEAEASGISAANAQMAFAGSGNGFAIWTVSSSTQTLLKVAQYTKATNTWSAPTTLATVSGSNNAQASLAVDSAGNAIVAWLAGSTVSAVRYSSGAWSSTSSLSTTASSLPSVAINGTYAAVMWGEGSNSLRNAYCSRWNGTTWSTKTNVDTQSQAASAMRVAIDSSGNIICVWQQAYQLNTVTCVWYRNYHASSNTWDTTGTLDPDDPSAVSPQVAMDANGNAIVTYGQAGRTYVNTYTKFGNTWSGASVLEDRAGTVSQTSLSVDAAGNAVWAWVQDDTGVNNVYVVTYNATTAAWGPSTLALENLTTPVTSGSLSTSMTGGKAAVAWIQNDGTRDNAYSAVFDGTSWSATTAIESSNNTASAATVAVDSSGNATALWVQSNGTAPSLYWNHFNAGGSGTPYYNVPSGATWQSLANTLYGVNSAAAGTALQTAMGGITLVAGPLSGFPTTLNVTTSTTITVPAYYKVPAGGASWQAVANAVYGINSAAAGTALQTALGLSTINVGDEITGFPATLTVTTTLAPHYVVPASATWPSIAGALFGSGANNAAGGAALQTALGNPDISTAGNRLFNIPATLTVTTTVPYYYTVLSTDTWSSISQSIYATTDANAIAALQSAVGTNVLHTGDKLTVPMTLNFTTVGTGGTTVYQRVDIQDSLGKTTTYTKDAQGRLLSAIDPTGAEVRYTYDAATGNIATIAEDPNGLNRITTFAYDANTGLLLNTRDSLGNTVAYTYNSNNQRDTETLYTVRDPDGAGAGLPSGGLVTHYVYDTENHLRFVVSADGRVTENIYDTPGQLTTTFAYASSTYTGTYTESALNTWATNSAQRGGPLERSDYAYDFRGNVSTITRWAATDSTGAGTGPSSVTRFIYDQRGMLLTTVEARGEATSTPTTDYLTSYTYDGLGRRLTASTWVTATETARLVESNTYDDANRRTVTTYANGLVKTFSFDKDNELTSVANGSGGSLGTTSYTYDAGGRLRVTTDPTGVKLYAFYDDAGRALGTVDGDGSLVELVYNRASQVIKTIRYATPLSSTTLTSLSGGAWSTVAFSALRTEANPTATQAQNQITRNVYDVSGARVYAIDQLGGLTKFIYDGAGRLTDEIRYKNTVSFAATVDQVLPSDITVSTNTDDRTTRHFYNGDGQEIGTLDGAGYLTETIYDAAGRVSKQIGYYNAVDASHRGDATIATMRPGSAGSTAQLDAARDITTRCFYDAQGRKVGELDGERYLTEYQYDVAGHVLQAIRYDRALTSTAIDSDFTTFKNATSGAPTHVTVNTYDGIGQLLSSTNYENTPTTYTYDLAGNVTSTTEGSGVDARTTATRYDVLGRATQELTAEGYAALAALSNPTQVQIDDIWSKWGVTYTYDNAGHRASATVRPNDSQTNTTYYYYDNDGRLRFTLDPLGRVTESRYNALGQLTDHLVYWRTVTIASPTGGLLTPALITALTATETANVHEKTSYGYSLRGEVTSTLTAAGATTATTYNIFGEVDSQNAGSAFTAYTYTYDQRGLKDLTKRGTTTFEDRNYDAFGRLASVTDARGNSVTTTFDRLGREITSQQTGDTNGTLIGYDGFSRVVSMRDKLLNTTSYNYNDSTRTLTVTTPEGIVVTTVHDVHGATLNVTANGNTTSYVYDHNGNLTSSSDNLGSLEGRGYDRAGRQVTASDARGTITSFTYDAANRQLTRTVDSASGGLQLQTTYAYDPNNRVMTVTEPGNKVTRTEYDRDGRVAAIVVDPSGTTPSRTEYTYDTANNTTMVIEGVGSTLPRKTTYGYDALGRRTDEYVDPAGLNLHTQYKYDNNNNVTRKIDAKSNSTWYTYDAQDRLVQTIDALGGVTQLSYDDNDRQVATRRFYNTVTTASLGDTPAQQSVTATVNDHVSRTVYDKDGRAKYTLDTLSATGTPGNFTETAVVTERLFDAAGNVTSTRVYHNPITEPASATPANIASALTTAGNDPLNLSPADHVERTVYDLRGRVEIQVDGSGAVTRFEYDANGNVTKRTEYANTVPVDGAVRLTHVNGTNNSIAQYLGNFAAGDVVTATVRFKAPPNTTGLMFLGDAGGPNPYDNYVQTALTPGDDGWQTLTLNLTLSHADDVYVYVYSDYSGSDNTRSVLYDDMKVTSVAKGTVLADKFDGTVGNWSVSGSAQASNVTLADLGSDAAVRTLVNGLANSSQDRVTRSWYDTTDRQRFSLDAEGYLTETRYLDSSKQEQDTVYAGKPSIAANATLADVVTAAGLAPNQSSNQTTTKTFDVAGRLVQATDANGMSEYLVYDAVGNKIKYVNKKAASASDAAYTWTFDYDANHRLVYERSPNVSVTTIDPTTMAATETTQSLVTHNFYDALGNLTSRVEAEGTTQARTTSYEYDLLGRQTASVTPQVGVYDPTTGDTDLGNGAAVQRREVTTTIRSETAYDVFGNAFRSRLAATAASADATNNAYTYKVYDNLGRVVYEVDAKNQVTQNAYDTFGNKTTVTRYAKPLTSALSQSSSVITASQVSGLVQTDGADRAITTSYDRLNRALQVKQPSVANFIAYVGSAGGTSVTAQPTTEYTYDAFGDVISTRTLIGSNSWATSYAYFDHRGLKTADLDASRYLTRYFYDDETGDLTRTIEYAQATTGTANIDSYGTIVTSANGSAAGDDRDTSYVYDKLNRKISETKSNLEYSSINGSGVLSTAFNGAQTTSYGYDALGNQTRVTVTDPSTGAAVNTYTYYDVLGRAIAIAQPTRNLGLGANATPYTRMLRNAFGDLVQQVEYNDGLTGAPVEGTLPGTPAGNASLNRVNTMLVDGRGNTIRTLDATGANRFASYNIRGDVAKEWQVVVNPNLSTATTDDITDTIDTIYRYDALGQQTGLVESQRYDSTSASIITATRITDYNAFGEVIAKYNQGATTAQKQYYDYDNVGRVWRTNADDGIDKVYQYDLQGNATVELRSKGSDLAAGRTDTSVGSYGGAAAVLAGVPASDLMRTETAYDLKGNIIERRMPTFDVSTGLAPVGTNLQLSAINGIAYVNWNGTLSDTVTETFEYRVAGSGSAYSTLNIEQVSTGLLGANVHALYNQSYEYRIRYTRGGDAVIFAESAGTFRVDRGINTNYSISRTPPDTSNDIPALAITASGPVALFPAYNGTTGWNGFAWQGQNIVSVNLAGLGGQPIRVVVTYTNLDRMSAPHSTTAQAVIDYANSDQVADVRWNDPPDSNGNQPTYGGLYNNNNAIDMVVLGKDGSGSYTVVLAQKNPPAGPPMLIWSAPADSSITANFKFKLSTDTNWSSAQATRFANQFRVPVQTLLVANATYNYEVEYVKAGNVISRRGGDLNSTGVVTSRTISGATSGQTGLSGVFDENVNTPVVSGLQLAWQPPSQSVTATFEYNQNGGGYTALTISKGSNWTVDLSTLGRAVTYGYRITYTLGNRVVSQQLGTFAINTVPSSTTTTLTNTPGALPTQVPDVNTLSGEDNTAGASATGSGSMQWDSQGSRWWQGPNAMDVSYADVGNRPVTVYIYYSQIGHTGTASTSRGGTAIISLANGGTGGHLTWTYTDTSGTWGGVNLFPSASLQPQVEVYGKDASGASVLLRSYQFSGSGATPKLKWTAPSDSTLIPAFSYSGTNGSGSLAVTTTNGVASVNLGTLAGTFNFTVIYTRPGETAPVITRSGGTFTANGIKSVVTGQGSTSNANTASLTLNVAGSNLTWARPSAGASVTFRYRVAGSNGTWLTDRPASTSDNNSYAANLLGLASGNYEYQVEYRSGAQPAAAFAQGTVNVVTNTVLQTDVLTTTLSSNTKNPTQSITPVSMASNSDTLSWSFAKQNTTDTITFTYTLGGTQYTAAIGGTGPAYTAQLALPIATNQSIPWTLTYTRSGETDPYAKANGTVSISITGTQTNPVVTLVSQALHYPSGVQELATPVDLGSDFLGWSSLSPEAGAIVEFKLNGTVTALQVSGSTYKINFASLTPGTTYTYELTFRRSTETNPYARAYGTFTTAKNPGSITGTNLTVNAPRSETALDVTPTFGTGVYVYPPTAVYHYVGSGQQGPHLEYGPAPYQSGVPDGGGYEYTIPPSIEYPVGTWTRWDPPTYQYDGNAQMVTWARTTGTETSAKFIYWPISNPSAMTSVDVSARDTSWSADLRAVTTDGTYGYRIEMRRTGAVDPYAVQTGTFTRSGNGATRTITPIPDTTPTVTTVMPTSKQKFDRWGNLIESTDASNDVTSYRYNGLGLLVQTLEANDRILKYNSTGAWSDTTARAEKTNSYDLLGRLIETEDGYDQANRVAYNAAGQQLTKRSADFARYSGGATTSNVYDIFGNLIQTVDELGYKTRFKYDKAGRMTEIWREIELGTFTSTADATSTAVNIPANVQTQYFVYDQAGRRVSETDGIDTEVTRYRYDHRGDVTMRITPTQAQYSSSTVLGTTYAYDLNGKELSETDALGSVKSWTYDAFGRMQTHTELQNSNASIGSSNGAVITYHYDEAGEITSQTSTLGQNITYAYDTAGNLTSILDNNSGINRQTLYRYDSAGRQSRESVYVDGRVQQDTRISYDAHNRIKGLDDLDYREQITYDANGNRSYLDVRYIDHQNRLISETYGYEYDEMNRVLKTTHYSIAPFGYNRYTTFGYDARGDRTSENSMESPIWEQRTLNSTVTYRIADNTLFKPVLETYTYDGLARLKTVTRDLDFVTLNGSGGEISRATSTLGTHVYTYDKANRQLTDTNSNIEGTARVDRVVTNAYDLDGRASTTTTKRGSITESVVSFGHSTLSGTTWSRGYDDAGNLRSYDVENHNPSNGSVTSTLTYSSTYKLGEGYLETRQSVHSSANPNPPGGDPYTTKTYNADGELIQFTDSSDATRTRYFANNQNGQVLTAIMGNFSTPTSLSNAWSAAILRGSYGGNAVNWAQAQYYFFAQGNLIGTFGQLQENGQFVGNFDVNHTKISDTYPASVPTTVVAQAGDTLRSIAARIYGDPSLWYVIAQENGLTNPDQDLADGMQLRIPNQVVSLSNTSDSFKPFNPADAIGNTTPTAAAPPPPKGGCGVVGMIIMIVVAIVVTVFTAGAAAAALAPMLGSMGSAIVGGAIGAAVGSIASQGVGIAIGAQDKFSWSAVGKAAIGGAIGGALFGVTSFDGTAITGIDGTTQVASAGLLNNGGAIARGISSFANTFGKASGFVRGAVNAVASNAITQGANMAFGLQNKFNWRDVAAAAIEAPLAHYIGDKFSGAQFSIDGPGGIGHVLAHAALGAGVAAIRGQDIGAGAIGGATEAFLSGAMPLTKPNAIGDALREGFSQLAAAAIAKAAGRDPSVAAGAADNAFKNNYLKHRELMQLREAEDRLADNPDDQIAQDDVAYYKNLDKQRDSDLDNALLKHDMTTFKRLNGELAAAAQEYLDLGWGGNPYSARGGADYSAWGRMAESTINRASIFSYLATSGIDGLSDTILRADVSVANHAGSIVGRTTDAPWGEKWDAFNYTRPDIAQINGYQRFYARDLINFTETIDGIAANPLGAAAAGYAMATGKSPEAVHAYAVAGAAAGDAIGSLGMAKMHAEQPGPISNPFGGTADARSVDPITIEARNSEAASVNSEVQSESRLPNGQWISVNESMSQRARDYQTEQTGRVNEAFLVNGVKFDGIYQDEALLDAKGPGYASFVNPQGNFYDWYRGADGMLDQAQRQIDAAEGAPIRWHFAEPKAADAMTRVLRQNGYYGPDLITIHPVPPKGK